MIVPGSVNPLMWGQGDPLDELGAIKRSLRLRRSVTAYLSKTFAQASSNPILWTVNVWVKRSELGTTLAALLGSNNAGSNAVDYIAYSNADALTLRVRNSSNVGVGNAVSNGLFRDAGAWANVHVIYDTANPVAADRVQFAIDGLSIPMSFLEPFAQNQATTGTFDTVKHIGHLYDGNGSVHHYADMYLANYAYVDGQALGPEAFGQFHPRTGQWRPNSKAAIKAVVDAGGANSFFLPFDDPTNLTTLCADASSKGNHWTANNVSLTADATYDSMLDTPTNNFATLNPLVPYSLAGHTITDGNLKGYTGTTGRKTKPSTIGMSRGKWYWEVTPVPPYYSSPNPDAVIGIIEAADIDYADSPLQNTGYSYIYTGKKYIKGTLSDYGATYDLNDVIGCAIDMEAGTLEFFKNGVSQGIAVTGLSGTFFAIAGDGSSAGGVYYQFNFGQRPFSYSPPTGFKALCTKNFKYPAIQKPEKAFVARTDTGANIPATLAAARPGWADYIEIFKRRDAAEGWRWRFSDDVANYLDSSTAGKAAFPALAGASYVGYALKAAAANGVATGVLAHVNGVADVVTDGLGNARKIILLKREDAAGTWYVYHPDLTPGKLLYLEQTAAETTDATISAVTASGFTAAAALPTGTYRWVALAEVAGFLKLWKQTGNSAANGPLAALGLSAGLLMLKRAIGGVSDFDVHDTTRSTTNDTVDERLRFNTSEAEATAAYLDLVSNGVKVRTSIAEYNASGSIYVGLAIAGRPFRYANAR